MRSTSEHNVPTTLMTEQRNIRVSSAPNMLSDGDDIEAGDSVLSASQLRKRYDILYLLYPKHPVQLRQQYFFIITFSTDIIMEVIK
jgi:hypothetical protein